MSSNFDSSIEQEYECGDVLPVKVADLYEDNCDWQPPVSNGNLVRFDDYIVASIGPKGDKGDKGDSLGCSILTEQLIPGEYCLGEDGVRKQVYTRTIRVVYPSGLTYGTIFRGNSLSP